MTEGPVATVFAVDDDERFLTAIGRVLQLGGYDVEKVPSAASFLQRPPSPALGCLLVDLQMPDMTGLEFHERLRATGWTQPVVFLSGQGTIPATTQALKAWRARFPDQAGQVRGPPGGRSARRSSVTAPSSRPPMTWRCCRASTTP